MRKKVSRNNNLLNKRLLELARAHNGRSFLKNNFKYLIIIFSAIFFLFPENSKVIGIYILSSFLFILIMLLYFPKILNAKKLIKEVIPEMKEELQWNLKERHAICSEAEKIRLTPNTEYVFEDFQPYLNQIKDESLKRIVIQSSLILADIYKQSLIDEKMQASEKLKVRGDCIQYSIMLAERIAARY